MLSMSAYVDSGKLCVVGLEHSPVGFTPFVYRRKVSGNPPDGPVQFGADDLHPAVAQALTKSQGPIMHQLEIAKMQKGARDLIERSRNGEQNATAQLMVIRQNARNPESPQHARAKIAYSLLLACVKDPTCTRDPNFSGVFDDAVSTLSSAVTQAASPPQYAATIAVHLPSVGGTIESSMKAATAIASGPAINAKVLGAVQTTFKTPDAMKAFVYAVKKSGDAQHLIATAKRVKDPAVKKAIQAGYTMGTAKRLQDVRHPDYPIKHFSQMAAWELGE